MLAETDLPLFGERIQEECKNQPSLYKKSKEGLLLETLLRTTGSLCGNASLHSVHCPSFIHMNKTSVGLELLLCELVVAVTLM